MIFKKISKNFVKYPLKFCLISQIMACMSETNIKYMQREFSMGKGFPLGYYFRKKKGLGIFSYILKKTFKGIYRKNSN